MADLRTTDEIGQARVFPAHVANDMVFVLNCHNMPTGPKAKRWARLKNGDGFSVGCLDGEGKLMLVHRDD